jgi:hypothetical protein
MNQKLKRIRQIVAAFVILATITGISSCEKYSYTIPTVDPNETLHFQADIQPIFTDFCVKCHAGSNKPDLRDTKSYLSLKNGDYVTLPAVSSKLYSNITGSNHTSRLVDMSESDKLKILYWIAQGALEN